MKKNETFTVNVDFIGRNAAEIMMGLRSFSNIDGVSVTQLEGPNAENF